MSRVAPINVIGSLLLIAILLSLVAPGIVAQPESTSNRLFCGKGSTINVCFALASVSMFVAHDRAVILNGGYSWTMPESDWARLVEFGRSRNYEIPESEGSR